MMKAEEDILNSKEWLAFEAKREKEMHERAAKFLVLVRTKLDACGHDGVPVVGAGSKDTDAAQEDTEWDLTDGVVIDGSHLLCKHHGDPTHGDFGTSFVVFEKRGRYWDKGSTVLGVPNTRPYNWGGRTTKSLEQALGVICDAIAKKHMRGKRR